MKEYLLRFTGADWASIVNTLIYFAAFCIAFFCLKDAIKSLMSRVKNFGGTNFASSEQAEQKVEKTDNSVVDNNAVVENYKQGIKTQLDKDGIKDEDKNEFLIKHLATAQILLEFERVYSMIFGGQIRFLKELNASQPAGRPKSHFEKHYAVIRSDNMKFFSDTNFSEYMGFLLARGLIRQVGDNYVINIFGIEFLSWMVREGKIEDKLF